MFTPAMLDHLQNPRNSGELPPPAITVEVTNPVCGDILRLSIVIEENRLRDVRFKTRGCVAAIASGSLLTELIKGKSIEEAGRLRPEDISAGLGGLPPESGHAAILATDALKSALEMAIRTSREREP